VKRISTLDVKTYGTRKVKRRTRVITSYEAGSKSTEKIKEDGQASSHYTTVRDADSLEDETESAEATETLKIQKASNKVQQMARS